MRTYNYNLKRTNTSIEGLKAKSSTQKNAVENKDNNKISNPVYGANPINDNLYSFKTDIVTSNIKNSGDKIFPDDQFYSHTQAQLIDRVIIFNKENEILIAWKFTCTQY